MADDFRGMINAFMELMEDNRNEPAIDRPKIGIFWWSTLYGCFGVDYEYADTAPYSVSSYFNQKVKCPKSRHEKQWAKMLRRGKVPSEYALLKFYSIPRGRVFSLEDGTFVVCHGRWMDEHPEAKEDILDEFDLPRDKTEFRYDEHWDIGHTWDDLLV